MSDAGRRAGVVELVTGVEPSAVSMWPTVAGAALVAGGLIFFAFFIRQRLSRDPVVTAFPRMARMLGLTRRQRAELRALAERMGVPPVALLMSEGACSTARTQAHGG